MLNTFSTRTFITHKHICLFGTIGKYPHLLVKESSSISNNGGDLELQFGEVPLCTSIEKSVDLINISPVSYITVNMYNVCVHYRSYTLLCSKGSGLI